MLNEPVIVMLIDDVITLQIDDVVALQTDDVVVLAVEAVIALLIDDVVEAVIVLLDEAVVIIVMCVAVVEALPRKLHLIDVIVVIQKVIDANLRIRHHVVAVDHPTLRNATMFS